MAEEWRLGATNTDTKFPDHAGRAPVG